MPKQNSQPKITSDKIIKRQQDLIGERATYHDIYKWEMDKTEEGDPYYFEDMERER